MLRYFVLILAATAAAFAALSYYLGTDATPQRAGITIVAAAPANLAPNAQQAPHQVDEALNSPADFYRALRTEPRDSIWADSSETSIRTGFDAIPFVGTGEPLRVTCAISICEVAGAAPSALAMPDLDQYWQLLRDVGRQSTLTRQGLELRATSFGRPDDPRAYSLYFRRAGSHPPGAAVP
jgi:hypothetical protein